MSLFNQLSVFLLSACLMTGCTNITLIFGADPDPAPMVDAARAPLDAGVPMADSGPAPRDAFVALDTGRAELDAGFSGLTVIGTSAIPSSTVGKGASFVALLGLFIEAGTSDETITDLTLERTGVGAASDFDNVYLYDVTGDRNRVTPGRSIDSVTNEVTLHGLSIVIPAGTLANIWLMGDVSTSAVTGGQHEFRLVNADAITTTRSVPIRGTFPYIGPTITIAAISADNVTFRAGSGADIVSGSTGVISQFTLNGDDIYVDAVTITQAGAVSMADLHDVEVFADGSTVSVGTTRIAGSQIVLDFVPGLFLLGGSTVTVMARVTGPADRNIVTYIEYPVDVRATDIDLSSPAAVCISPRAEGGCTTAGQGLFDGSGRGTGFEITVR